MTIELSVSYLSVSLRSLVGFPQQVWQFCLGRFDKRADVLQKIPILGAGLSGL